MADDNKKPEKSEKSAKPTPAVTDDTQQIIDAVEGMQRRESAARRLWTKRQLLLAGKHLLAGTAAQGALAALAIVIDAWCLQLLWDAWFARPYGVPGLALWQAYGAAALFTIPMLRTREMEATETFLAGFEKKADPTFGEIAAGYRRTVVRTALNVIVLPLLVTSALRLAASVMVPAQANWPWEPVAPTPTQPTLRATPGARV